MAKHFHLDITDTSFHFARQEQEIAAVAARDGLYVIRTSLPDEACGDAATVRIYKSLARVERAFRCRKTVDLHVRPVYHWLEGRVRAHVFLCMLSYYLEWHVRQRLAPTLYEDPDKEVARAARSPRARRKEATKCGEDGLPVHGFHTLIADLATLARNTATTASAPDHPFTITTRPTPPSKKPSTSSA